MTDLQTKQLNFLNDTVSHFNFNNRCKSGANCCQYSPIEGKSDGCAIGRHISDKELCKKLDTIGSVSDGRVISLLPDNLKELGVSFLVDVQKLHDCISYWDYNGISQSGRSFADDIKANIENNVYLN